METVRARIQVTAEGAEVLDQISGKLDRLTNTSKVTAFSTALSGLQSGLMLLQQYALGPLERIGVGIVQAAIGAERTRTTWQALITDSEKLNKRLADLERFSAAAPYTFASIQQAAMQMQVLGQYSERAMTAAGDAAAIFGTQIEDAVYAMQSALRGEMEPLKRYGITTATIAEEVGHRIKNVNERTAEDTREIWDAIISLMEQRGVGGMERIMQTVSGQLTNLSDAWMRAKTAMGGELMEGLTTGLDQTIQMINDMNQAGIFKQIGEDLGSILHAAVARLQPLIRGASTVSQLMAATGKGGFSEQFLAGNWSAIPERRQGYAAVLANLRELGPSGPLSTLDILTGDLPRRYRGLADEVALAMIRGAARPELQKYIDTMVTEIEEKRKSKSYAEWKQSLLGGSGREAEVASTTTEHAKTEHAKTGGKDLLTRYEEWLQTQKEAAEKRVLGDQAAFWGAGLPPSWAAEPSYGARRGAQSRTDRLAMKVEMDTAFDDTRRGFREMRLEAESSVDSIVAALARIPAAMAKHQRAMVDSFRSGFEMMNEIVAMSISRQMKAHVRSKDIFEAVMKGMLASFLRTMAAQEAAKAAANLADMFSALAAVPLHGPVASAAAAAYGAAAAKHAVLATMWGAGAVALEMQSGRALTRIQKQDERERESARRGTEVNASGAGAQIIEAGVAPQPVNYHFATNYYGSVIYGHGGTRDWFYREVVPLINEALTTGALRTA